MPASTAWDAPGTPFTLSHLAPLGVTRAMLRSAVSSGRVTSLCRGVFIATEAMPSDPVGLHLVTASALQTRQPELIAAFHTAALAWELAVDDSWALAERRPAFVRPNRAGVRSARTDECTVAVRDLPAGHRTRHPAGLMVTTRARAALDTAAATCQGEALAVLDSAARMHMVETCGSTRVREHYENGRSLTAACALLRQALGPASTHRTARRLGELVSIADPRRESWLESRSYELFLAAGIALPKLQVRVQTPEGPVWPDCLWERERVIGEADGLGKYSAPRDLAREAHRQHLLEQMGFRVVRWERDDILHRPQSVVHRIVSALDARS